MKDENEYMKEIKAWKKSQAWTGFEPMTSAIYLLNSPMEIRLKTHNTHNTSDSTKDLLWLDFFTVNIFLHVSTFCQAITDTMSLRLLAASNHKNDERTHTTQFGT